MRALIVLSLTPALWALGPALPASAAPVYPWCAHYSMQNGPHNCGFVSFEQCLETVRGIGGFCDRNPYYSPPTSRPRHRRGA